MNAREIEALGWPASRLGEATAALLLRAGLCAGISDTLNPKSFPPAGDAAHCIEWHAKFLDCEAEQLQTTLGDLEPELANARAALLRVSDSFFLAIVDGSNGVLRVLTPNLSLKRVPVREICDALREPFASPRRNEIEQLLARTQIATERRSKTVKLLLMEQLGEIRFDQCWMLRISPGARPRRWLREANAFGNAGWLLGAHTAQYLLWLASWAILGTLCFEGRMDRGWLLAWALLLMSLVPLRVLTTWLQGSLAISVGGLLKRRLLAGALRLGPEETRHQGIGSFLGQVFEAEAVETLALGGGVAALLAVVEIAISGFVLGRSALLLLLVVLPGSVPGLAVPAALSALDGCAHGHDRGSG